MRKNEIQPHKPDSAFDIWERYFTVPRPLKRAAGALVISTALRLLDLQPTLPAIHISTVDASVGQEEMTRPYRESACPADPNRAFQPPFYLTAHEVEQILEATQ